MATRALGGIICPLATPSTVKGEPDLDVLVEHIRWVAPQVDGIVVLGSSGELASLPDSLIQPILRSATQAIPDDITLYVGVGDASTARALARLDAVPSRADYVLVCGPYYFQAASQVALLTHFTTIAGASPRPVVLYNLPQNVGVPILPETVLELAGNPNVVGIKDSSGDMFGFQSLLRGAPAGFKVMQGREQLAAISLWAGCHGLVSSLSNFAPDHLRALINAVEAGDRAGALRLQAGVSDLARVFDQGHWLAAMKAVLEELGLPVGAPIPPLPACTADQRAEIRRILRSHQVAPIRPLVA